LFKRETVERFAAYFINIIQGVGANSQKRISAFEIITEEEKKRILVDFNNTETGYPGNTTVHRLFEEQAAETPDHVGLVGDVGQVGRVRPVRQITITYRQLNEQSASVAGLLIEKGVLPDNIVAITMGRSVEMIVGIMGILKSGGAYLPIDPEYPQERIDYMLKDSGAEIIINHDFLVSAPRAPLHHSSFMNHHSNQLAYIIYTSGSTGNAKGVMVEHRSLVNLCHWHNSFYSVSWRDRATKYAGFGFDASVWEIFPYLAAGASLYIVPGEIILDIEGLNRYYEKNGITIVFLPTQVCEQFMELNNKSLRVLLTGGDKLKNYIKKNYRLYNNYGPTENTVVTTSFWVTEESSNIPIGKPIANNQVYILDRNNCLQPVGIPGELCVAGGGIARGYLNNPVLTSDKFYRSYRFYKTYINYKTGDLARWLPDPAARGAYIVEFLGRMDYQVKVRGFRIELGEIEAQLTNNTNIKEAVATVLAGEKGDKYLCAYFVSDKELRIPELRETLVKKLPDYMIPSYFVQLEKFPLTANGKIDRKALPEPGLKAGDSYIAPRDGIEEKLVLLWSEILGKDPLHVSQLQTSIGIDDNFFESGGHSLRAMTLVSRIRKEFDVEFPLGNIFSEPTVQGMARFIKNTQKSIFEEIKPVEKRQYYPLSSAQKRLFFLAHVENIGASYNTPAVLNVKGKIDIPRFEHAIKDVIKRHEALRTSFHLIKNEPAQRIHDEVEFEIEYKNSSTDYTDYPDEKDYISHFVRSFDLSRAPLLRVCLVSLAQDRLLLLYDMHHIIGDGTSSGVLIDDFIGLYAGENLQPLKIQYKDFSHWQNNLFENGRIKAQEDYWINLFRGDIPRLTLPTDYPRPVSFSFAGDSFVFTLDSENTSRLKQLGLANGTTLYMNLLAAFNALLYKYTGQDDIIVGGVIAGRRHADLQRIIGMFVNTLAMRNYPHGDKTFPGFLKEVKENSLNAFENQDVQFEELVAKLDVERDPSRNPLFDVCFVMQNAEQSQADLVKLERTEDVVFSPYEFENKISQFDLTIDAFESAGEIHFKLEYCTGLFNIETTRGLARHFLNIIGEIAAKQDSIPFLADIDIMTEEEKRQALVEFNDSDADYPVSKYLHDLFADQASMTPDHIALVGSNSQ
ncbi:MAG: hypothetical protein QG657_5503, partial [Acidobacteriota bacterium]|nr:hypothetical protein [Acidobacteriota bacterium]